MKIKIIPHTKGFRIRVGEEYTQDVNYTRTEGFKQFKAHYNIKNARAARNDPNRVHPSAETIYQAVKGLGCTLQSFDLLSLDDFISAGSMAARCRLNCLSLVPYYAAQMKRCTQKWDRHDDQGAQLGGHQRLPTTGWYHRDGDLPFHGRCSVYGEIELWIC